MRIKRTHSTSLFILFIITSELVTVIGSNHFGLDEYIKQYLLQPDLPFISFIKIGLRYYITPELIVQLNELKEHLNIPSYEVFYKCYTRFRN